MSRFRLADLGPGLLLAAAGIGVGDMVSSIIAGAEYGLTLIWALAAGVLVKYAITEGAARWQLATDRTLVEGWRDNLPAPVLIGFFIYFVVWSYMVASALVSASALVPAAVFPSVSIQTWGILHATVAFAMVYFGRYEQFLAVVKWFIAFKVLAVIATVLLIIVRSGADWSMVGARSDLEVGYVLSLIGGIGGTVTLLSYGYWMREEGWSGPRRMNTARIDLLFSFGLAFVFGLAFIIEVGLILLCGVDQRTVQAPYIGSSLARGEYRIPYRMLVAFGVALVLTAALTLYLSKTFTGRAIKAVAQDEPALRLMGANPVRIKQWAFGIATGASALAGAMLIIVGPVEPAMDRLYIGRTFCVVVLAGLGSMTGTLAAGLILGIAESIVLMMLGASWAPAVAFGLLLVVLGVRPQGLFGR